ncbi:Protein U94 [Labeo rohita]|uniref:Protein U94 n=1 Tax=Labeo rohita TaxID=84645 RepID=A0ABQ8L0C6_LABRO|nr:Protein U94 [Labeo rohita]
MSIWMGQNVSHDKFVNIKCLLQMKVKERDCCIRVDKKLVLVQNIAEDKGVVYIVANKYKQMTTMKLDENSLKVLITLTVEVKEGIHQIVRQHKTPALNPVEQNRPKLHPRSHSTPDCHYDDMEGTLEGTLKYSLPNSPKISKQHNTPALDPGKQNSPKLHPKCHSTPQLHPRDHSTAHFHRKDHNAADLHPKDHNSQKLHPSQHYSTNKLTSSRHIITKSCTSRHVSPEIRPLSHASSEIHTSSNSSTEVGRPRHTSSEILRLSHASTEICRPSHAAPSVVPSKHTEPHQNREQTSICTLLLDEDAL